jgi:hypothetical protein
VAALGGEINTVDVPHGAEACPGAGLMGLGAR